MSDIFDQIAGGETSTTPHVNPFHARAVRGPASGVTSSWDEEGVSAASAGDAFDQVEADPESGFRAPAPPMPGNRPSSSDEFDQAQAAGGYTEPAEKSGRPITYLMQKPDESYPDFLKRAVAHGKTLSQQDLSDEANQPGKIASAGVRAGSLTAGTFGALAGAAEAIEAGGPLAHRALQKVVQIAAQNKTGTGLALLWAINKGLEAAGLPKASKIVESLELPAILLLSGSKGSAAGDAAAAEGSAATSSEAAAEESAAAKTESAAAKETPEQFMDRMSPKNRATVKPNSMGQTVDADTGEPITPRSDSYRVWEDGKVVAQHPKNNELFSTDAEGNVTDLRTAEEKAATASKPGTPKIIQRGPKKGQAKTYKVFDQGKWVTVPVYK